MGVPQQTFTRNALNFVLMVAVAFPALYFQYFLTNDCIGHDVQIHNATLTATQLLALDKGAICKLGIEQPLITVNVIFFLNVCVLFWVLSLIQGSTWLIDPYWTIIPVMIAHFYASHPAAQSNWLRSTISLVLVWIWSVRLTHSYFRREEWQFGAREDWRFTELQRKNPGQWWWQSFFIAYFSQQFMLVGITLPLYGIHSSAEPFHPILDTLATILCIAGLVMAYFADTQLRNFMIENEKRVKEGKPKVLILDSGVWRYSRRPNYFGEQLWWWGLSLYACNVGQYWMIIGTLFNSICMVKVTHMVEQKMLENKEREQAYREYMRTTSAWIPWFKGKAKAQ